jgi:hypothetical protein
MAFHSQRLWYAFGRKYAAGDIVANIASGTGGPVWQYRDSVIKVTENSVAYGGDAFVVPTMAGNIRGMGFSANLNTNLGESDLYIFTRRSVYAMSAPITREDWTAATLNMMPLQKVALAKGGSYGDRCIVPVNRRVLLRPPNGDIRTIRTSVRDTETGEVPLSNAIERLLVTNDKPSLRHQWHPVRQPALHDDVAQGDAGWSRIPDDRTSGLRHHLGIQRSQRSGKDACVGWSL